ncbi:glycosyl transferase group 1 [Desulfofarcimen acetoxidans DSM 771]|uniref:Glycosyl transferase group 1 n=1 Tax=Desulfofarcimen acetoxidans (strain ATCC 49208 / DSM 771 / KCTC 5769 / VKM B-1644 / 5575) TaxID=485916 RepID=C8VYR8_DESAS|nr:glycosyltransferase [Desulfofarcimen acetoxidans]ACV64789.1 glycosyl transferase group 1 [Desulfofarcimen acetoxidans DSM 771]
MNQLRVLHIIGGGEFGGAERHILNLCASLDSRKVAITVVCLFEEPFARMAKEIGVNVLVMPMRHKLDIGTLSRLTEVIKKNRPDLVHTHGVRANLLGRLAAKMAGVNRIVTTVHSLLVRDYPDFWSRLANSWTERLTRGLTDHFIAVSQGLKNALIADGIPENKITVIYNGLDLDRFRPCLPPGTYRHWLGYEEGVPLVAIVARLHSVKGHSFFLQAAAEVLKVIPRVRFLVVGTGPDEAVLKEMTAKLGLQEVVNFTGFITEIPDLMADMDVLVIPSLWEGFGLTAIEAMTVGLPVVATEVGGLPEVVRPGETGILVPSSDVPSLAKGIIWVLQHPKEASQMAENGRQIVSQQFSSKGMARKTELTYQKVMRCDPC